jgi:hypothetical protein
LAHLLLGTGHFLDLMIEADGRSPADDGVIVDSYLALVRDGLAHTN